MSRSKKSGEDWEVINLGSNGTYVDGVQVERAKVLDGNIVRLASSGPKILIKIESDLDPSADASGNEVRTRRLPKSAKDTLIS